MKVYRVHPGKGVEGLQLLDEAAPAVGHADVRVRVRSVSLNYRDLMLLRGQLGVGGERAVIPCSDGAGEVVERGQAVTRFQAGDRVAGSFFPHWIDGRPSANKLAGPLGATADGMLAQEVTLPETALVRIPDELDDAQASTLPCAGVTAWNALFVGGDAKPGDSVLLLGTGGVSILALQMAHAAGLRTIVTSSSDDKLERARSMGAHHLINYRTMPRWQDEVLRLTGGRGVDLVLEVGGAGTLAQSARSVAVGGTLAVIGGVTGFGAEFQPFSLVPGACRMIGINVGSRTMLEALARFYSSVSVKPVIDRSFDFLEAPQAFAHLAQATHVGKIVIRV